VAGTFQSVGLQSRHGLAAFSADGDVLDWNPSASALNDVMALAVTEHALFVAGQGLAFQQADSGQALAVFPRPGAPRLLGVPNSLRAPIDGTASFMVQAEGLEPLFFRWQLDGTNIVEATNSTLLLTNLSVAHSGRYMLIVSNTLGFVTAEASLLVLDPVHIDAQPASQTVAPGTTITLSVNATGSPPPIYQWRRNGVNIPGAVYPTLTVSNASPTSGGTYSVAIANSSGVLYSAEARVVVTSAVLPFANDFTDRGVNNSVSGIGSANNAAYTKELLEPRHAGKPGGKSAWLEWIAPTNGIVTFSTLGSGFDTLLAIYTNDTVATLGSVTSDDDRGGFLTSRAAFNAIRGVHYQIAIDGLGGESGDIVLGWQMEVNAPELPLITAPPLTQSVTNGSLVIFSVGTVASSTLTYQWYFGCQELRGATNDTLVLASAQLRQVGFYRVVVTSASGRSSESLPAALEIGPIPGARSYNKLADLLDAFAENGSGGGGGFRPAATGGTTPFLLSIGIPKSFYFKTDGSGTYSTVTDCGLIVGAGAWLYFTQLVDGVVVMDTIGSSFNTLLTVFNNTNLSALPANVVACNDDGAPDNVRSLLHFFGTNKHQYIALVTGVAGSHGTAQINWRIVPPPLIVASNLQVTARTGGSLTLDAGVLATNQEPRFQWYFKGVALTGYTNRTLRLSHLSADQSGSYQVIVGNDAGTVTNTRAIVQITPPPQLEGTRWDSLGRFTFQIRGDPNAPFNLETSSNLLSWSLIQTGRLVEAVTTFTDTNSRTPPRFYRLVEPAGSGP
jgi:hypothetical protein